MSLPNASIASTFIESYITIRKANWNLNVGDDNAIKIPEDFTVKHKLTICLTLLEAFNNAKTFEDWIKILDEIYVRERTEFETHQHRYAIIRALVNPPLAGNMLHAIRTYIVSELKHEPEFKQLKDSLSYRKKELEKQILWDKQHSTNTTEIDANQKLLDGIDHTLEARNDMDEYFLKFFAETIIPYDIEAKRFDEKSFDDLKLNVQKNKRTLVICQHILADNAKKSTALSMNSSDGSLRIVPVSEQIQPTVDQNETVSTTIDKNETLPQPTQTYASVVEGTHKTQSSLQALSTFAKPDERISGPRRQATRTAIANHEQASDVTYPKSRKHRI